MLSEIRIPLRLRDLYRGLADRPAAAAEQLEQAFADRFQFPHAVLFPLSRTALSVLLAVLDRAPRPVLCPAYTCSVVPQAVAGADYPVTFVDSAADTFLPDVSAWSLAARATKAAMMIATPLYGYPVDKEAEAIVRSRAADVFVLYDEAQSFGAADAGGLQSRDADGALVSLGLSKMLTALSGGVLLLRDTAIWRAVRAQRDSQCPPATLAESIMRTAIGLAGWLMLREPLFTVARVLGWLVPALSYDQIALRDLTTLGADQATGKRGLPAGFQSGIGLQQIRRLNETIAQRRAIGSEYERRLREGGFRTFGAIALPTWPRFPLAVADRAAVVTALSLAGVQAGFFLRYSCAALPLRNIARQHCPNADGWARSMINLPIWHGVTIADVERITDELLALRQRDPSAVAWPELNSIR